MTVFPVRYSPSGRTSQILLFMSSWTTRYGQSMAMHITHNPLLLPNIHMEIGRVDRVEFVLFPAGNKKHRADVVVSGGETDGRDIRQERYRGNHPEQPTQAGIPPDERSPERTLSL